VQLTCTSPRTTRTSILSTRADRIRIGSGTPHSIRCTAHSRSGASSETRSTSISPLGPMVATPPVSFLSTHEPRPCHHAAAGGNGAAGAGSARASGKEAEAAAEAVEASDRGGGAGVRPSSVTTAAALGPSPRKPARSSGSPLPPAEQAVSTARPSVSCR